MRAHRIDCFGRHASLTIATVLLLYGASEATASTPLAPDTPTLVNGIETVCTGIGLNARQDLRWTAYPLKVEIVGKAAQYLGDVRLTVTKDLVDVVDVTCEGPWVLLRLPKGRYEVRATVEGVAVTSPAYVTNQEQGRIILRFPDLGGARSPEV